MTNTITNIADELCKEFKEYYKVLSKYGVSVPQMVSLEKDIQDGKKVIVCTNRQYKRLPSGRYQRTPYEDETKQINVRYYLNCIASIPFFKDRVEYKATKYGNIPCRLTCFSWGGGEIKKVSEFTIEEV